MGQSGLIRVPPVAAVLGAVSALLLGSGVVSLTADSAVSEGNEVVSGLYDEPGPDLQIALVDPPPKSCDPSPWVEYGDGPVAPMTFSSPTFDLDGEGAWQVDAFCLLNNGDEPGNLTFVFEQVVETELRDCEASESGAGDTTCGEGASGELAGVVTVSAAAKFPQCASVDATFQAAVAGPIPLGSLEPGKACLVTFSFQPAGSSDALQRAQTDRLQWDLRFTLQGS